MSLLLGVNIDHVATLRQARYSTMLGSPNAEPCPLAAALEARDGGADSITIHVRGDRRHMQESDAFLVRDGCPLPLNFEMAATAEMLEMALRLKPQFVCLVPENRSEVTTEGGLDAAAQVETLASTVGELRNAGIKVSLFIDPEEAQIEASAALGVEMIELHTGCFANATGDEHSVELERLIGAARQARATGLQVNAGHGINYQNIAQVLFIPHLAELNIGHSIVSRALTVGLRKAVHGMKQLMRSYRPDGA